MTEYLNIDMNIYEYVLDKYYETVFVDFEDCSYMPGLSIDDAEICAGYDLAESFRIFLLKIDTLLISFYEWPSTECCSCTCQEICVYYPDRVVTNKGGCS